MNEIAINIIPKPRQIKNLKSSFDLLLIDGIRIENNTKYEVFVGKLFKSFLKPLKDLEIEHAKNNAKNKIMISLNSKHNLEREEYKLIIRDRECITLEASHESGLFYGFQSFRQLCDPKLEKGLRPQFFIPSCEITDSPSFSYRGMHLDVSRHFFDIKFIKTYIDRWLA